ncbi:TraR/DksA C4-type zinc finger protein [Aurantiacibacter xanthus]|nr:TraR/DksA C4-type zinc finger protein [Aurantiacibacter xanthus]
MQGNNRTLEASELFEEEQRDRRIAMVRASLSGRGEEHCCDCGDPIDVARRMAMPNARRCFDCQEDHERR